MMKTNMLSAVLLAVGMMFGVSAVHANDNASDAACNPGNASFCDGDGDGEDNIENSFNYSETSVDVDIDNEFNQYDIDNTFHMINVDMGELGGEGVSQVNVHTSQDAIANVGGNDVSDRLEVSAQAIGNNLNGSTYFGAASQVNVLSSQDSVANVGGNVGGNISVDATSIGNNLDVNGGGSQVNKFTGQRATVNVGGNVGDNLSPSATSVGNNASVDVGGDY